MDHLCQIKTKPINLYLLGLLCVIPLVGAFVGVVLIFYGCFRYRDKWLTIIGAGGILFTVLVYGSVFWAGRHSTAFYRGFQQLSQLQLNNLVRYVEFYKAEHGNYPANLEQLRQEDPLTPIHDPGRGMRVSQDSLYTYTYHTTGNNYALFGRGADFITGTSDDVFPKYVSGERPTIGWLPPDQLK